MMDTLAYAKRLRAAGVSEEQAEAHAEALNAAVQAEVATKADLIILRKDLQAEIAAVRGEIAEVKIELRLHRWVLGFVVTLQIAILIKLIFI